MVDVKFIKSLSSNEEVFEALNPVVRIWFEEKFSGFTESQRAAILPIKNRKNILVSSPTGSGKTLCAFTSILDYLICLDEKGELEDKVYVVYISPLKALSRDIEVNLKQPLKEMEKIMKRKLGIRIAVRTGDTPTKEKQDMLKRPPHILITTPETLSIVLTARRFIENLKAVEFVIVDEIHALANKRGVHLSLSLERLQEMSRIYPVRIGLSACLKYDQKLWLSNGLVEIGKFVERNIYKKTKLINDMQSVDISDKNIYVFSYDGKKLTKKKILKVWRIPAPRKIARIKTDYGKSISLTTNDKVLKLTKQGYRWANVSDLAAGDLISAPFRIDLKNTFDLWDVLLKSKFGKRVRVLCDVPNYRRMLKRKKLNKTLKEFCAVYDINYKAIIGSLQTLSISEFKKICKALDLNIKKEVENLKVKGKTGISQALKIPQLNRNVMWLLGILASDGHNTGEYISLVNKDRKICEKVKGILEEEFGLRCGFRMDRKYCRIRCKSVILCNIMDELGIRIGKKTPNLRLSPELLKCDNDLLINFVKGYIDGNGVIDKNRIAIHSSSEAIIEQIRYILFRNGIACSKEKSDQTYGDIHTLRIFRNNDIELLRKGIVKGENIVISKNPDVRRDFIPIGCVLERIKDKYNFGFKDFDKRLGGICSFDIIKRGYSTREKAQQIVKALKKIDPLAFKELLEVCENNITTEKIKEIEIVDLEDSFVYDLSVEDSHNFVAEGLIVHNTVAPLEEIAKFLSPSDDCLIADVQFSKRLDIGVLVPVRDLIDSEASEMQTGLYKLIDRLIQNHRTTLIFTNTRSATERVMHHLKEMFPSRYLEDIGAHHSSLGKRHRFDIEERLRNGKLKVVVTSTSLELGIDVGYIDLVILLGSPKSSARSLQRIGRSGHKLHDIAKGRFIVLDRDDLVECCVLLKEVVERKIDKIKIPKDCLDVLAQQIYGMAIYKIWDIDELFSVIKRSYCYRNLNKEDFLSVISYLAGEYALEARNVYAKIWYDPKTKQVGKRGKLARVIYMTNIGTIPEESFISVVIAAGERKDEIVGKIDEAFLERLRKGDVFVLGGHRYQFLYTRGMKVYVKTSVKRPPTIPSWFSEMLPLSFDSALEIGRFRRLMEEKLDKLRKKRISPEEIKGSIKKFLYCNKDVANSIYDYFYEQYNYAELPTNKKLLIEHYKGEKNYIIFHSLFGRRVNDALSRAYAYLVARTGGRDIEIGINDNGFFLAGESMKLEKALKFLKEQNIEEVLKEAIEKTEVLKRRFRHCAARSLMILRSYKGRRKSVGKQQLSSRFLLGSVKKISAEFPILKEARREVLQDLMDVENAKQVLRWIEEGKLNIKEIRTSLPSPFALNLIMQGHYDLIKMEDKIAFLKRMHELHLKEIEESRRD